jgi:hypothetical protein
MRHRPNREASKSQLKLWSGESGDKK